MLTRALAPAIGLAALLLGWPAPPVAAAPAPPAEQSPLVITIDSMTPSYVPAEGPLTIHGRVTNRDDVPWSTINLYPFISASPLTSRAELADAVELPADQFVGERVTSVTDTIAALQPGTSRTFTLTIPRNVLAAEISGDPGVYWFGVHALGESVDSPREPDGQAVADGRARTFLPYVPPSTRGDVKLSLVMPLRRFLAREADGSLSDPAAWLRTLTEGGRLREAVDFGDAAGPGMISWLVDPALLDAVLRLARGNPPRSLGPTLQPADQGESPSASPSDDAGGGDAEEEESAPPTPLQTAATTWLSDLQPLLRTQELLTLPYGDLDIAAAADHAPELIELADTQASAVLDEWGVEGTEVVGSPSGYLDPGAIAATDSSDVVLMSDRAFGAEAPAVGRLGGRKLVVASAGAAAGGPAPGDRVGGVGLRQRILSEAALRVLEPGRDPLFVVLPPELTATRAADFVAGLEVPWVDLTSFSDASKRQGRPVSADELVYPQRQQQLELDPDTFRAVDTLVDSGEALQNLLTLNDQVGADVTEEALSGVSFTARQSQNAARAGLNRAITWIQDRLGSVQIGAPPGVTLSSESGDFVATITNRLDQPVTVSVRARSDSGIEITPPESIELAARSRASVLLEARTDRAAVHNVTLVLTDTDGTPLGSSDQLPIRSAQVSNVIWVIMGSGAVLLFGAILVRLVRRIRRLREPQDAT